MNFFAIFFRIFFPGSSMNGIPDLNFFSLFLGLSQHLLDRNKTWTNFFNFLKFFLEVPCSGWVRTEFGTKIFFFSFSAYLIPFWLKLMPGRGFLIFWIFFLGIFLPRSGMNRIWVYNFFFSFSAYLISFCLKIRPERRFLTFCYFFQNFLALFDYEWKSGLKFFSRFLGLSHHILGRNNAKKRFV